MLIIKNFFHHFHIILKNFESIFPFEPKCFFFYKKTYVLDQSGLFNIHILKLLKKLSPAPQQQPPAPA